MSDEQETLRRVRELTGQSYANCQQALALADGDVDRAVNVLRSRGETYTIEAKETFNALLNDKRNAASDE